MTDRELAASAQAMLGECVLMLRLCAELLEGFGHTSETAATAREVADRASAIRWEGINSKEDDRSWAIIK